MVMYLGKVVEIAEAKGTRPQSEAPYTQALLSAVPVSIRRPSASDRPRR